VDERPNGTLVFTTAEATSEHEVALLRHPQPVYQIEADQKDPSRAVRGLG